MGGQTISKTLLMHSAGTGALAEIFSGAGPLSQARPAHSGDIRGKTHLK